MAAIHEQNAADLNLFTSIKRGALLTQDTSFEKKREKKNAKDMGKKEKESKESVLSHR